jgi:hypothetical protein
LQKLAGEVNIRGDKSVSLGRNNEVRRSERKQLKKETFKKVFRN